MPGQNLQRGVEGGFRNGMAVPAKEKGAIDSGGLAMAADRLGDRQDMVFIEGGIEGRAAMTGCAKADALGSNRRIGLAVAISLAQRRHVQLFVRAFQGTRARINAHADTCNSG